LICTEKWGGLIVRIAGRRGVIASSMGGDFGDWERWSPEI